MVLDAVLSVKHARDVEKKRRVANESILKKCEMGIQGLLPLLSSIHRPVHLSEFEGKTLAIDGYSWLHKGVFSCATEICLKRPTTAYDI